MAAGIVTLCDLCADNTDEAVLGVGLGDGVGGNLRVAEAAQGEVYELVDGIVEGACNLLEGIGEFDG